MKTGKKAEGRDKIRMAAMVVISLLVIATGTAFSLSSFAKGDLAGGVAGVAIAIIILAFAAFVFARGSRDLKHGFPLRDERSRRVIEKATSMAFYLSMYSLLAIGFLSEDVIRFRDVSQATGIAVGIMAIMFAVFWAYYSRKGI
jgi:uncharacterized membrane protein